MIGRLLEAEPGGAAAGMLSAPEAARLQFHFSRCAGCTEAHAVLSGAKELTAPAAAPWLSTRITAAKPQRPRSRWRGLLSPRAAIGVAYALALVVMLAGFNPADLARKAGTGLRTETRTAAAVADRSLADRIGAFEDRAARRLAVWRGRGRRVRPRRSLERDRPRHEIRRLVQAALPSAQRRRAVRSPQRNRNSNVARIESAKEETVMEEVHSNTLPPPPPLPPPPLAAPVMPPPSMGLPPGVGYVDRKSAALAGLLSMFPGLGHLYLGLYQRGIVFGIAFVMCIGLAHRRGEFFGPVIAFIWFFAIIDAVRQAHAINRGFVAETGYAPGPAAAPRRLGNREPHVGRDPRRTGLALADRPVRRHRLELLRSMGRSRRVHPARPHPDRDPRAPQAPGEREWSGNAAEDALAGR